MMFFASCSQFGELAYETVEGEERGIFNRFFCQKVEEERSKLPVIELFHRILDGTSAVELQSSWVT